MVGVRAPRLGGGVVVCVGRVPSSSTKSVVSVQTLQQKTYVEVSACGTQQSSKEEDVWNCGCTHLSL